MIARAWIGKFSVVNINAHFGGWGGRGRAEGKSSPTQAHLPRRFSEEQPGISTNKSLAGHPKSSSFPSTYYESAKRCPCTQQAAPENAENKQGKTLRGGRGGRVRIKPPLRPTHPTGPPATLRAAPRTFRRARPPSPGGLRGVVAVTVSPEL